MNETETTKSISQAEIENAKKLIAEIEKKEFDSMSAEAEQFIQSLNKRGFTMLPAGTFIGSNMQSGWQIVRMNNNNPA